MSKKKSAKRIINNASRSFRMMRECRPKNDSDTGSLMAYYSNL